MCKNGSIQLVPLNFYCRCQRTSQRSSSDPSTWLEQRMTAPAIKSIDNPDFSSPFFNASDANGFSYTKFNPSNLRHDFKYKTISQFDYIDNDYLHTFYQYLGIFFSRRCGLNGQYPLATNDSLLTLHRNCVRVICSQKTDKSCRPQLIVQGNVNCSCSDGRS